MPIIPTIHINGNDQQRLIDLHCEVSTALVGLATKIHEAAPNARDYYVQGPDAHRQAMAEHRAMLVMVDDLRLHYSAILEGIQAQADERAARRR